MKTIRIAGMITGLEAAKAIALRKGNGAKKVRVLAWNGFACLRKCGKGYAVIK